MFCKYCGEDMYLSESFERGVYTVDIYLCESNECNSTAYVEMYNGSVTDIKWFKEESKPLVFDMSEEDIPF